ncbi:dihydropteroate synthase [Rhodomicrobium vannielii ATCC 17100]|uniref:dihydropteroate synthase n=1 Tax=Rhodomicrobium vannielii TaxID=1069 RepID=UPI00191A4ECE|nr:dihydropteroate synthase [Rhodomicrobium vannielii]MBJ7534829.1 dihydropteroate synthase [Rhodomicrobium vannielii ATCC 17100]
MPGLYLEPTGFLYGEIARQAIAAGEALPLAGSPRIAFSAARLQEGGPGGIRNIFLRASALPQLSEPRVKALLARIIEPRADIAGVPMDGPRIMGILNVTPDSFSDGGDHFATDAALAHAADLVRHGTDFIDVGGESTRPGSDPVDVEEEVRRILPVLEGLAAWQTPVSVDTRRPEVMRAVAGARLDIINDVSALTFSSDSLSTAAELCKPVVLMHAQGDPKTMQDAPSYADVVTEVFDWLEARIEAAVAAGIDRAKIVADPGIGFGKTLAHNAALLRSIALFHGLGVPLLVGTSRKRSLQRVAAAELPGDIDAASVAAALDAASRGVQIVRMHNVEATAQALAVWRWLNGSNP